MAINFHFDPVDLPRDYRDSEWWREYLFTHAIRGRIEDETNYVSHLLEVGTRSYHEKREACGGHPAP